MTVHREGSGLDTVTITISGRRGSGKTILAAALVWFLNSDECRLPPYLKSRIRIVEKQG